MEALARQNFEGRVAVLLSRDLDGINPFLDPHKPVPEAHLRRGAERFGISEQEARDLLAACEPVLGWNPLTGYQSS